VVSSVSVAMIPNPNTENFPFLGGLESHGPLILFGTDQEVRAVNYKRSSLFIFLFLSQALRLQIGKIDHQWTNNKEKDQHLGEDTHTHTHTNTNTHTHTHKRTNIQTHTHTHAHTHEHTHSLRGMEDKHQERYKKEHERVKPTKCWFFSVMLVLLCKHPVRFKSRRQNADYQDYQS